MSDFDLRSIREALEPVEREYRKDLRELAEEIIRDNADADDRHDAIHEAVDSNWWVIYTFAAQAVCLISGNDGAYIEEYGDDGVITDGALDWSRLAYGAMYADLTEEIEYQLRMAEDRDEDAE